MHVCVCACAVDVLGVFKKMTTPLKSLVDMAELTCMHVRPDTHSLRLIQILRPQQVNMTPQSIVHKRPFQNRECRQKQRLPSAACGRIGEGWERLETDPKRNKTRNGENLIPGSLVRWLVTSHRAAEAQLSWGC